MSTEQQVVCRLRTRLPKNETDKPNEKNIEFEEYGDEYDKDD